MDERVKNQILYGMPLTDQQVSDPIAFVAAVIVIGMVAGAFWLFA